jgi:circadian clock protein KaiB
MHPPRLELYIVASTPSGQLARRNVEEWCAQRWVGRFELSIHDLGRSPVAAQQAGVLVTPTLVLRRDGDERRCFGEFRDFEATCAALQLEAGAP